MYRPHVQRQARPQACNDNGLFNLFRQPLPFGGIVGVAKANGPISMMVITDHVLIIAPATHQPQLAA